MKARSRRRRVFWTILLGVVLTLGAWGAVWLERYSYGMAAGFQMAALAKALFFYHHRYGDLPDNLATVEASGLLGDPAYRLPANGWEILLSRKCTGLPPHFVPVDEWDGNTEFVVAVRAVPRRLRNADRVYVLAGNTTVRWATEEELGKVLAEDDRHREQAGQKARWAHVRWQKPNYAD